VVLAAAMIAQRYRWVVTLEPSATYGASEVITVRTDDVLLSPRKVVDCFGDRSNLVQSKRSLRLLLRRQLG
jgi:hypothetical protein